MRRGFLATLWATRLIGAAVPAAAAASPVSAVLTGGNGEGTFNPTLPCGQGDGPSWRYAWLDGQASGDGLLGTWDGTFEVHDAGRGRAFVPNGDGRLAIANGRGTGFFETLGDGGCDNAPLDLTTQPDGDPQVSGTLPVVALGGTGALRGLTGSGTATVALELGPGADNLATVELAADLDLPDAQLTVVGASSRWPNLSSYLARRLAVSVTLENAQAAGDAFDVQLTSATGGTGSFSGLPTAKATIPAGGRATFTFTMNGASANRSYTIGLGAAAQDGLFGPHPPTTGSATFRSPLLP